MLNGPCSSSREDRCEVSPNRQCAWQLIYQRLKNIGQLDRLKQIAPPKNWAPSIDGGYRTIIREDHRIWEFEHGSHVLNASIPFLCNLNK
jgi:hypothetical protein